MNDDKPIYLDTETTGIHGILVLIQYAIHDGPIKLVHLWKLTRRQAMKEIEFLYNHPGGMVVFNGTFESFHFNKFYNILLKMKDSPLPLERRVDDVLAVEAGARWGVCLKPQKCLDLMLICRQLMEYQCTMRRDGVRIRKVPTCMSKELVNYLNKFARVDEIMFARSKEPDVQWKVYKVMDKEGNVNPFLREVALNYKPNGGLKAIAAKMGIAREERALFLDLELKEYLSKEKGYAPFAEPWLNPKPGEKKRVAWPEVVHHHINYWYNNKDGQKYAMDDVYETRDMHRYIVANHLNPQDPYAWRGEMDDDNSVLAFMVGAVRWKGFDVNVPGIEKLMAHCLKIQALSEVNFNSVDATLEYLMDALEEHEQKYLLDPYKGRLCTKTKNLEDIVKNMRDFDSCPDCFGLDARNCNTCIDGEVATEVASCRRCETGLFEDERQANLNNKDYGKPNCNLCRAGMPLEAALRSQEIIDYRINGKEIELYNKIITARRFHAGFNIIGALSGRLSGADDLNAQGIKNAPHVRKCFTLGDDLGGGDYESFEVGIMDSVYRDPVLNEELKAGYKIHAIFGTFIFPDLRTPCTQEFYDDIKSDYQAALSANKTAPAFKEFLDKYKPGDMMTGYWAVMGNKKRYKQSKQGLLGILYGADASTLTNRLGIDEEVARQCFHNFCNTYKTWGDFRSRLQHEYTYVDVQNHFQTKQPKLYAETLYGFKRFFNQEYNVLEKIYELIQDMPSHWQFYEGTTVRSETKGEQTHVNAVRSSLWGCILSMQASIFRTGVNHAIQGSGAQITKGLQCTIWGHQPHGISSWVVAPINIHDEVMCVTNSKDVKDVKISVDAYNESVCDMVPLTGMKWATGLESWNDKE